MVASLDGIVFHQFYGDNSGGAEFDTDGDGAATQEDEFVSVQNASGSPIDISGWEIWSDSTGTNSPDTPGDGKYHTFPPGTVLAPGETLYIINEITGTPASWMQEASEGGVESGAGGVNTNLLSEGGGAGFSEGVALVNPDNGEYIVLSFANEDADFEGMSGFPGSAKVAETNAANQSGQDDQNAGSSFQYDSNTDSYVYQAVTVPCFASGSLILTPMREIPVETLRAGDLVVTADHGALPLRWTGTWTVTFDTPDAESQKPIEIKAGSLGANLPHRSLIVAPQHRMLFSGPTVERLFGVNDVIGLAKGLLAREGVRRMKGKREMTYHALLFDRHEIIFAERTPTESFWPGVYNLEQMGHEEREEVFVLHPSLRTRPGARISEPARPVLKRCEVENLVSAEQGPLTEPVEAAGFGAFGMDPSAKVLDLADARKQRSRFKQA